MSTPTTVKIDIPNLRDGEVGFMLDGVNRVAASVEVKRDDKNSILTAFAHARYVDENGMGIDDAHGQPVEAFHSFTVEGDAINDPDIGGQAGLVRHTLLIVLGDETALADMNDNIRHAIEAAAVTGPVDLSSLDLSA